jgi:flagellar biosynthesis protein FlhF
MNVKKFTAATSREALRKVRDALGPDAVILSNRPVDGVVEILALDNDDVASLAAPAPASDMAQPQPRLDLNAFDGSPGLREPPQRRPPPPPRNRSTPAAARPRRNLPSGFAGRARRRRRTEFAPNTATPTAAPRSLSPAFDMAAMTSMMSAAIAQAKESAAAEMSGMMSELRAMRGMMETQLAELSWGNTQQREPQKAVVLREMLAAGFSASAVALPDRQDAGRQGCRRSDALDQDRAGAQPHHHGRRRHLLDKGGVFALVGPTGVGKTTTTAKLAARCVMRHGPEKLALITTDAYRIGGHEQLRIYGKILGVMVHSVKDEADLRIALKELKNKHTVLIDTIGMSQRDQMVTEQVAMLTGAAPTCKRLLCLNATSTNETLAEVVRAYQGSGLHGCIMTKLDEAASIGNVLDV